MRSDASDVYGVRDLYWDASTRPEELSMYMMRLRVGISADCRLGLCRSWMRCWRRGMLLRGSLRGRLDSALIIRWLVSRWLRAATTCVELNERLIGI